MHKRRCIGALSVTSRRFHPDHSERTESLRLIQSSSLRRNGIDALSLFALPLTAALLPRRLSFALMKRLARNERLYRASVDPAWQAARQYLPELDEETFRYRYRLLRLVDQVDTWLTLLRSARWWHKQVDIVGEWPESSGPFLLLTFHWGAGGFIWKLLRRRGVAAHFLARRASYSDMGLGRVALWYARFREWAIVRIGCAGPIFVGGSKARIRAAFAAGSSVMGMLDLPADEGRATFLEPCMEWQMRFPRGLVDLAIENDLVVILVSAGLDHHNGRREVLVEVLPIGLDAGKIAERYAEHFSRRLAQQPGYWQLWQVAPALFERNSSTSARPPLPK